MSEVCDYVGIPDVVFPLAFSAARQHTFYSPTPLCDKPTYQFKIMNTLNAHNLSILPMFFCHMGEISVTTVGTGLLHVSSAAFRFIDEVVIDAGPSTNFWSPCMNFLC